MIRLSRLFLRTFVGLTAALSSGRVVADGPGFEPDVQETARPDVSVRRSKLDRVASPRPARRVTDGPDYVGSDYGLGKPSFYGIGSRPDWGRSSID